MGKVLKKLAKIKQTSTFDLMQRFKHIVGAKALREYLASKTDVNLNIEIRLTEEELLRRITIKKPKKNNNICPSNEKPEKRSLFMTGVNTGL